MKILIEIKIKVDNKQIKNIIPVEEGNDVHTKCWKIPKEKPENVCGKTSVVLLKLKRIQWLIKIKHTLAKEYR